MGMRKESKDICLVYVYICIYLKIFITKERGNTHENHNSYFCNWSHGQLGVYNYLLTVTSVFPLYSVSNLAGSGFLPGGVF